jgi:hypothetical protein
VTRNDVPSRRRSRAASLVAIAALGVACAARTELGATSADASSDGLAKPADGSGDAVGDAIDHDGTSVVDAHDETTLSDVVEECTPVGGPCVSDADCCNTFCGFHSICGAPAPPYGGPPP